MKTYTGYRTPQGCVVKVHAEDGTTRELPLRLDLRSHSPDGPEWGYGGSGPAQLVMDAAVAPSSAFNPSEPEEMGPLPSRPFIAAVYGSHGGPAAVASRLS